MKAFPWIIIALLLLVILYLRECSPKPECQPGIVTVDTIPGDTVIQDTIIYRPHLVYQDTGSTRWLSQKIDTAAILAACMAVNHYRDTLMNDTSALVVVDNEVSMNALQRTRMKFLNRRSRIIYASYPDLKKQTVNIYAGFQVIASKQMFDCGISVFILPKQALAYGFVYRPFTKSLEINIIRNIGE